MTSIIKTVLITAVGVIIGIMAYELGKKVLGLDSYEENYELSE